MAWWPFRRRRRDTTPISVPVFLGECCSRCERVFRDSPGNWHCESPTPGVCNVCHHDEVEGARPRAYTATKIGF